MLTSSIVIVFYNTKTFQLLESITFGRFVLTRCSTRTALYLGYPRLTRQSLVIGFFQSFPIC